MIAQRSDRPSKKYEIIDHPVDFKTGEKIKTLVRARMVEPWEQYERIYNIDIFRDWEKIAEALAKNGRP